LFGSNQPSLGRICLIFPLWMGSRRLGAGGYWGFVLSRSVSLSLIAVF